MADEIERHLRGTFDEDAELYERVRPGYPPEIFDDLAELTGIGPGCRLLEIGAGTGKATLPLALRGCRIIAVELGANMAAVAARNLAGYPDVEIVVSAFETWPLPAEPFDVVLAATAFHWLDPAVRMAKIRGALRAGGVLAVVETHHVAGGTTGFFADSQACYRRWDPATPPGFRLSTVDDIPTRPAGVDSAGGLSGFGPPKIRRYEWEQSHPTAVYLDLLMTYSGHRALPEPDRSALLNCIGRLIDDQYGGRIAKRYLTQLWVTRRAG
jgi:SAM-dependent methyltransferase